MFWVLICLLVLALSALLSWAIIYAHYCRSPEKRWRDRVRKLETKARGREKRERKQLDNLAASQKEEEQDLERKAFFAYLDSISSNELDLFPGIGPATVGKLSQAGYTSLASLQNTAFNISGLGGKRLTDIKHAIQQLTKQARGRFLAGACQEAQTLKASLEASQSEYHNLKSLNQARLKAVHAVLEKLEPMIRAAQQVTFLNYCRKNWKDIVPAELLESALPDLVRTIHQAEEKAKAMHQERVSADRRDSSRRPPQLVRNHRSNPLPDANPILEVVPVESRNQSPTVAAVGSRAAIEKKPNGAVAAALPAGTQIPLTPASEPLTEREQEEIAIGVMESSIQFAFLVARAQGPALAWQKALIQGYFCRRYEDDPTMLNRARAFCAQYENSAIDSDTAFCRLHELLSPEERSNLFELAGRITNSSGASSKEANGFLAMVATKLGVPYAKNTIAGRPDTSSVGSASAPANDMKSEYQAVDQSRAKLEIDPTMPISADLVRRQFHLLRDKYNPEKVADMGPEFVEISKRKSGEILMAAKVLLEQFGEKLENETPPPKGMRENPDLDAAFGV